MSCVIMVPNSIGHQDLASLIARQPGVAERGRQHIRTVSTLTALQTATFSFPRPLGSVIPEAPGYQLASLDPRAADVTGSIRKSDPFYDPFAERAPPPAPTYQFPTVERRLKGDMLVRRDPQPAAPAEPKVKPQPRKDRERTVETPAALPAIPAWTGREPFAISQKLIADAARSHARRVAAAEKAAREAMLAMKPQAEAEPFAVPQAEIAAAERIEAQRLADSKVAALPAPVMEQVPPVQEPAAVESKPTPIEYPAISAWAQPATEWFAISDDLIAETERIAMARDVEQAKPAEAAALTPAEPEAENDVEAAENGAGIPVVENDKILTDDEPRDDETAEASPARPDNPAVEMAKLYFGADSFGASHGGLEAYKPGEAPTLVAPGKVDPDIKLSAITPPDKLPAYKREDEKSEKDSVTKPGVTNETIAPKGEVTGEGKRPRTPAERLGLTSASRAKQERCLTNAIYFESRGEPERGQMAVAQVVMNRVFSPYYPETVCGVVYQNSHKHNACQFTFACDNVRDVVTEPEAWETAKRISRDTLDGKIWLPEIGKATHYHATYVSPWWKRTMNKYKTLGIHIFYRPKRWGDGSDEPTWDPTEVQATGSIKAPDKSHATAFNK
jgi:spore germination cell wall hydrolase CwlJ-like protein